MARTVTDAAILLGALSGEDPRDPIGVVPRPDKMEWPTDYTKSLDRGRAARGAHRGGAKVFWDFLPETAPGGETALELLRREGAVLIDPADKPTHGQFKPRGGHTVPSYEFKAGLNAAFARNLGWGRRYHTLKEIIEL